MDADCFCAVAEILDDFADLLRGALGGDVVDDYGGAAFAELDGTAATDASTGAGDEGDLVVDGLVDCLLGRRLLLEGG